MGNEHLEPSRGFSWLLLKVRRHMNLETLCQRRHLLAGSEEMQCSPPVSRVQCEPGSAALLPRVPRRRRRVLPAASALLPRAVHPPCGLRGGSALRRAPAVGGLPRRAAGLRAAAAVAHGQNRLGRQGEWRRGGPGRRSDPERRLGRARLYGCAGREAAALGRAVRGAGMRARHLELPGGSQPSTVGSFSLPCSTGPPRSPLHLSGSS